MKIRVLCLATCATMALSSACFADDMISASQLAGTSVGFLLKSPLSNATLSVSGPDEFHASAFSKSGAVAIDLAKLGALEDGTYNYQVTAATDQPAKVRTPLDNGREPAAEIGRRQSVAMSGTFVVKGGKIVEPSASAKDSKRDEPARGTSK